MAWANPPAFDVATPLDHAPLNVLSGCLTALKSSIQIMSITTSPLVGDAPALTAPNFLFDINEQTQDTNGSGIVSFNFGSAFPNGVLIVMPVPGEAGVDGLVVNIQNATVSLTGFSCVCYQQSGSTYVLCVSTNVVVQWIAVGF